MNLKGYIFEICFCISEIKTKHSNQAPSQFRIDDSIWRNPFVLDTHTLFHEPEDSVIRHATLKVLHT